MDIDTLYVHTSLPKLYVVHVRMIVLGKTPWATETFMQTRVPNVQLWANLNRATELIHYQSPITLPCPIGIG
jgi:hypothetical protein